MEFRIKFKDGTLIAFDGHPNVFQTIKSYTDNKNIWGNYPLSFLLLNKKKIKLRKFNITQRVNHV